MMMMMKNCHIASGLFRVIPGSRPTQCCYVQSLFTHSEERIYSSQLKVYIPPLRRVFNNFQ